MSEGESVDASQELDLSDSDALLLALRDIYLPDPVDITVAPWGVWLLVFFLLGCVGFCAFFLWHRHRRRDPVLQALAELEQSFIHWKSSGSAAHYFEQSGVILKRLAIRFAGRNATAKLSGSDWVQWLNGATDQALPTRVQQALVAERYRAAPEADIAELHRALSGWMRRYKRVCRA